MIVPKLDIPVFTNMGFESYDLHVYVDHIRSILPDLHPRSAYLCHEYLVRMHAAFDRYDMKKFKDLQQQINRRVYCDMLFAEDNGEHEVAREMNKYFINLRSVLRSMRAKKLITRKG